MKAIITKTYCVFCCCSLIGNRPSVTPPVLIAMCAQGCDYTRKGWAGWGSRGDCLGQSDAHNYHNFHSVHPKKAVGGHCGSASRTQEPGWTGVEEIADWEEGERGEERGKTGQADSWEKEERRRRELCERRWERGMRGGTRKLQPWITASWQFWRGWLQN